VFALKFRELGPGKLPGCLARPLLVQLQPLGLLYLALLFVPLFGLTAMATRLILPSDLRVAMEFARSRVLALRAAKSAPDG
jgi:hypothetical protein